MLPLRTGFLGFLSADPDPSDILPGQWWFNYTDRNFKFYDGVTVKTFGGMSLKEEATGTLTADGSEQTIIERSLLMKFSGYIDLSNMVAGDTVVIRQYMQVKPGGNYRRYEEGSYTGVQDPPLIYVTPKVTDYGVRITLQQIAGIFRDFDYTFIREH